MNRIVKRPSVSFEQWAEVNGIKVPADHILAEVIGGAFIPSKTRSQKGKWRSKIQELATYQDAHARYAAAVASGAIPTLTEEIPLDMSKAADVAYARAMAKRAARLASTK